MKKARKILVGLMAMVMLLGMCMTVNAAGDSKPAAVVKSIKAASATVYTNGTDAEKQVKVSYTWDSRKYSAPDMVWSASSTNRGIVRVGGFEKAVDSEPDKNGKITTTVVLNVKPEANGKASITIKGNNVGADKAVSKKINVTVKTWAEEIVFGDVVDNNTITVANTKNTSVNLGAVLSNASVASNKGITYKIDKEQNGGKKASQLGISVDKKGNVKVTKNNPADTVVTVASSDKKALVQYVTVKTAAPAVTTFDIVKDTTSTKNELGLINKKNVLNLKNNKLNTAYTYQLAWTDDVKAKDLTFVSNKSSVATVDKNGKITAKGNGTAKITVSPKLGNKLSKTITVKVSTDVEYVKVAKDEFTILANNKTTANIAAATNANASNKAVTYKITSVEAGNDIYTLHDDKYIANFGTDDQKEIKLKNYASVSKKGVVKAKKECTVWVTATAAADTSISRTVTVKAIVPVDKLTIGTENDSVAATNTKGTAFTVYKTGEETQQTLDLTASATSKASIGAAPTDGTVTWKSNKESVATVDPHTGVVTAVANGKATITATANDGSGKKASATVTVVVDAYDIVVAKAQNVDGKDVVYVKAEANGKYDPAKVIAATTNKDAKNKAVAYFDGTTEIKKNKKVDLTVDEPKVITVKAADKRTKTANVQYTEDVTLIAVSDAKIASGESLVLEGKETIPAQMLVGSKVKPELSVKSSDAEKVVLNTAEVTVTSSNAKVIAVNKKTGELTAKQEGTATLKVTAAGKEFEPIVVAVGRKTADVEKIVEKSITNALKAENRDYVGIKTNFNAKKNTFALDITNPTKDFTALKDTGIILALENIMKENAGVSYKTIKLFDNQDAWVAEINGVTADVYYNGTLTLEDAGVTDAVNHILTETAKGAEQLKDWNGKNYTLEVALNDAREHGTFAHTLSYGVATTMKDAAYDVVVDAAIAEQISRFAVDEFKFVYNADSNSVEVYVTKPATVSDADANLRETVVNAMNVIFEDAVEVTLSATVNGAVRTATQERNDQSADYINELLDKYVAELAKLGVEDLSDLEGAVMAADVTFKVGAQTYNNTYETRIFLDDYVAQIDPEYNLVWEDSFNGTELNRDDWNVELHEPGWVNAEWQAYVDSEENIYLKDGKLVIQPIKTPNDDGTYSYTSGRVNTQNKHDFKYGRFEAKVKVPSGMGYLPAFWMMPANESFYGQWPKCGEIDIMEVMGQSTDTLHGTIHYGEPHGQKQGTYVIEDAPDFAEGYHVYAVDWEPGKITWYVDGIKFHEATDWYTKREGFDETAFPAPFDQPFYMILNVAVGGSWVGYPDETTEFGENAQMVVDYVRVYQKDAAYYEELEKTVTKPAAPEIPDSEIGANLLKNGDFSNGTENWTFLTANGGAGSMAVTDTEELKITTEAEGTVDYSVQLVQGPLALKQGNKYKVSFDAYADEAREIHTMLTAPDLNYIRYWGDTVVNLTTEKQHFEYEFEMVKAGDANSRFEMTFGAMGSKAAVYLDNIVVEKVSSFEIEEEAKTVLPDGNYIYNGNFEISNDGTNDRMKYWTVNTETTGVECTVTNSNGVREFKAVVPETVENISAVSLVQKETAITGGKDYLFTVDTRGAEAKTIEAVFKPYNASGEYIEDAKQVVAIEVGTETSTKTTKFTMPEGVAGTDVIFNVGVAGTTYIDNVRVQEDAILVNGNFSSGTTGWVTTHVYGTAKASFAIDELDNGSGTPAMAVNINDTGSADWNIQLTQAVTLEEGKCYKVAFDAWSTMERKLLFAIQRNADKHGGDNQWTSYSGDIKETLSTEGFKHYEKAFKMTSVTDDIAEVKFTMGAVDGQITTPHTIFIDNVTLEEIDESELPEVPVTPAGDNMFENADFATGELAPWELSVYTPEGGVGGVATASVADGKVTVDVTNTGSADGTVALKYNGLTLENGAKYKLTFKATAEKTRQIKPCFMDPVANYAWYGGQEFTCEAGVETPIELNLDVTGATSSNILFQVGLGVMPTETPACKVTMSDFKLVKVDGETSDEDEGTETPENPDESEDTETPANLVTNGDFTNGLDGWTNSIGNGSVANVDGKAVYTLNGAGVQYGTQAMFKNMTVENGATYTVSFKVTSSVDRQIKWALMEDATYAWQGGNVETLEAGVEKIVSTDVTVNKDSSAMMLQLTFSQDTDMALEGLEGEHTITLDDVVVMKKAAETPEDGKEPEEGITEETETPVNLVTNGDFTNGLDGWTNNIGNGSVEAVDGKAVFTLNGAGVQYGTQAMFKNMTVENGATYTVTFKVTSSVDRQIKWALMEDATYAWQGGNVETLEAGVEKIVSTDVIVNKDSSAMMLQLTFSQDTDMALEGLEGEHTITLDDVVVIKKIAE